MKPMNSLNLHYSRVEEKRRQLIDREASLKERGTAKKVQGSKPVEH